MDWKRVVGYFALGAAAGLMWLACNDAALGDIRQPISLFNSRGRPWLNQLIILKVHEDSAAVDTAFEVGGGLYWFQVDPDSGFVTDTYDVYRGTELLTGWTAVRFGVPESPDSSDIAPASISYTDLNLDSRVDSSDVKPAGLAWSDMALGPSDTLRGEIVARFPTAGTPKGFTLALSDSGSDLGSIGSWGLRVINNKSFGAVGLLLDSRDPARILFQARTGLVQIGSSSVPYGASELRVYNKITCYDTLRLYNAPKAIRSGGGVGQTWAGVGTILAGQDTCLVALVAVAPDSDDVLVLTPYGEATLWIDYRERWGFRVRASAAPDSDLPFGWLWIRKDL